jgi:hypothetical protein
MEVAGGLGVFMFMHAILPQEQLEVPIDNSVPTIDVLDEVLRLAARQGAVAVAKAVPLGQSRAR